MSDAGEKPIDPVAAALAAAADLGAQKRATKRALKGRIRDKARVAGKQKAASKVRRLIWLKTARVIDLAAFQRMRVPGVGARKLARALGCTLSMAQRLMGGVHWQQDPEKVREFNRVRGASIDPETGMPTVDDLGKFGGPTGNPTRYDDTGTKDLRDLATSAGVSPDRVTETVRRVQMLAGLGTDLPDAPDTKYFQDAVDQKLAVTLACLDPVTIASASVSDLTRLFNALTEKRALLRGEPTSIVRNEHRGGLDKLAEVLLAEVQRRGVVLDLPAREVAG